MKQHYPILFSSLTLILFFVSLSVVCAQDQQLAFPGAEGFGRFTSGGRGGVVYEVINLNDSGPGSLRHGIEMSGARTIVFRVSGNIHLETDLRIRNGNLTLAGQTAPGEGITIKGSSVIVDADNVIVRYLRFRPGDIEARELDALWGRENKDVIIDHCSMSWSTDEVGSFYDNENFTLQWCILSESLYESVHDKGRHGYGGIWGGKGATFHHNLLAHHSSRNPRFNGARYTTTPETELVDFRNNVIFNWGGNSAYGGEGGKHNLVANYYKAGPATSGDKRFRIINPSYASNLPWSKWYVADNFVEGYPEVTSDNWNGGVQGVSSTTLAEIRVEDPFPHAPVTTQTAEAAFASVLAEAGASYYRDPLDVRITEEVATGVVTFGGAYGAGKGIIDTQETVGSWPELFSAPAPLDTDADGMPNDWETALGLNPEDPADGNGDLDDDGYTNLEEYLNGLLESDQAEFLRHPSALVAETITTTSIALSWNDNSDREAAVVLERAEGEPSAYVQVASLEANSTTYVDASLVPGQLYHYRLYITSGALQSAYSPALAVQTKHEPTAPDGEKLVGFWAFNEPTGERVEDLSLYDNTGELKGASSLNRVAGMRSNALDFGAADAAAHVLVPAASQINFDVSPFSLSLWIKGDAESNQAYLLHKGSFVQSTTAGTSGKWYGLEVKEGMIRFSVDDNMTKSEVSTPSEEFLTGEWVHLVAVRDRAADVLRLYRNGELVAEANDHTNGGLRQTEPLILGNSADLNTPYTGMLDEVRIYNDVLSEAEVMGIYTGILMKPFKPFPVNAATDVMPEEVELSWSGDAAGYALYMGTAADQLELVATDLTDPAYMALELTPNTTYYWQVVALGEGDATVEGDVWSYTTGAVTGLEDEVLLQSYQVYPNPFSGQLNILFELQTLEDVTLSLYDFQNRLVAQLRVAQVLPGKQQLQLGGEDSPVPGLREGVYLCVLQTSSTRLVRRVVFLTSVL